MRRNGLAEAKSIPPNVRGDLSVPQPPKTRARYPNQPRGAQPEATAPGAGLPLVAPYEPPILAKAPPPPPVVADGVGDGYESAMRTYPAEAIPIAPNAGTVPLSVYQTKKRWRAIDVYVASDYQGAAATDFLTVAVYAIVRGVRTLVASGRMRPVLGLPTASAPGPKRVCAVRVQSQVFEVVVQCSSAPNAAGQSVTIGVVATDEANGDEAEDEESGVISASIALSAAASIAPSAFTNRDFPYVPVALHAMTTAAAVRYLQFAALAAGATLASFRLEAGGTLVVTDKTMLRRLAVMTSGGSPVFRQSSTPFVNTPTADVVYNWWFR